MALTSVHTLRFVQTPEHACSYLENQQATNVFVDPNESLDAHQYSALAQYGFRRSGNHVYRPHCQTCHACIPFRVICEDFTPSRSQKRCWKRNHDLQCHELTSIDTEECYALYEKYIRLRHHDGDMYPPNKTLYNEFLSNPWQSTRYLGFRNPEGTLLAVAICDQMKDGLSAMYSFFDPDEKMRSLGVYCILYQRQLAESLKLPYLYLGYWVKGSQKMAYKQQYRPYQLLIGNKWHAVQSHIPVI